MSGIVSMFENAQNININGSLFVMNPGPVKEYRLDLFFKAVSLNAILNAGGRADEVGCYPGTREEIIGKLESWMDGKSQTNCRMLWLSGHAGAGKSAIAQTVAERGATRGMHAANFFFFRGDNTRSRARPLVSTLLYQLINFYPSLRDYLNDALTAQPLMHDASVGEQFARLLAPTIEKTHHSLSIDRHIILIIDGLDECDNEAEQVQILSALHALVSRNGSPFRVLVASRAEPHLVLFFNKIESSVESLFLSDDYKPEDDIRKFVTAKFHSIKQTHHLAHMLSEDWPSAADIHIITSKSSGQFIYAATVMRFIEYSKDSPSLSLLTVRQIRRPTDHSPFAQLDALYSHVFKQARDIRVIKWALAFHALSLTETGLKILRIVGYSIDDLQSRFADVSALARIFIDQKGRIGVEFYHASLPDYLKDPTRSTIYHLDEGEIAADASTTCLQEFCDADTLNAIALVAQFVNKPTDQLSKYLLDASTRKFDHDLERPYKWDLFIRTIIRMYYKTNKVLCKRILRGWLRFAYVHKFDAAVDYEYLPKDAGVSYQVLQVTQKFKFIFS